MTAASAVSPRYEIETRLPLRAEGGHLELTGWCLAPGATQPPAVRLRAGERIFPLRQRLPRPDVVAAFAADPAATDCGFVLEGTLPPGAHRVLLEASENGEDWRTLRELCVAATPSPLAASIEFPGGPVVRESTRLQGWCVHPDFPLAEVWLHYGNREVRCEYGLPRTDVPGLFPGAPGAAHSGFITSKNISTGFGPLRVRGVTTTGEVFFASTPVTVDIAVDEENPVPLDLHAEFPGLGPIRRAAAPPFAHTDAAPRRILFALYGDFTSNSALHVASLANALVERGHECVVAVPHHAETIRYHPGARFRAVHFEDVLHRPALFRNGRSADVIHAWTTRENVRIFCEKVRAARPVLQVIHLEDHELRIAEAHAARPLAELLQLPDETLGALLPATLSHPRRSQAFLQSANAVTVIVPRLRELVPPRKPTQVIWPAADESAFFARPIPWAARHFFGWDETHTVLFYPGNVHATNAAEVRELYAAVALLNESGVPATLIRTGRDEVDFLGELRGRVSPHIVSLGRIDQHQHLAPLMALADYFVQPGAADAFNDHRFPSKLPEFFSLGRPVILPRTNLGEIVRHGEDAWVLSRADAAGIAEAVRTLRADPALVARLSRGAQDFASLHFSWPRSAATLLAFYNSLLSPV